MAEETEVAEVANAPAAEEQPSDPLNDKLKIAEQVAAHLSSDGPQPPPLNPCPVCGKESAEHTPDPDTGMPRLICLADKCRHVRQGVARYW